RDFHVTGVQTCALPISYGGVSVDVDGADLRNASYRGIEATHGSIVNGQNVLASGAGDRGVLAYANSFIDIDGADVSGAEVRCIEATRGRSEEHTSELQSRENLVCRLLLEKKNNQIYTRLHCY